jgi:hypothetical protein
MRLNVVNVVWTCIGQVLTGLLSGMWALEKGVKKLKARIGEG